MTLKTKKKATRSNKGKEAALKSVTTEKMKRLNANLPESLYLDLKVKATKEGRAINDLVIEWVNKYLSK
jgi:predicted HicB family RNase H-like nuclease